MMACTESKLLSFRSCLCPIDLHFCAENENMEIARKYKMFKIETASVAISNREGTRIATDRNGCVSKEGQSYEAFFER